MEYYCFELRPTIDSEEAWEVLTESGYELLYSEQEPDSPGKLYGYFPKTQKTPHDLIAKFSTVTFDAIDWQDQWKNSGGNEAGIIELDLTKYFPKYQKKLLLHPGEGFGDFSHATTRQALTLLASQVKGKYVLDIGCGSGVLGLVALCGGAKHVHAIDIDAKALHHTNENALNNQLENQITTAFPGSPLDCLPDAIWIAVMNMISSEQQVAWESLGLLQHLPTEIVTSGILEEQRTEYLELASLWGWNLLEESSEDGWLAFRFSMR